jgi:predicted glycosyltransferase
MTVQPFVLFQVPNQIGLGHMNRMACVALALRELDPAVNFLFVVEGSSHGLLESFGLPCLSLPTPYEVDSSGAWGNWIDSKKVSLMQGLVNSIIEQTSPDLMVYDCFPSEYFVRAACAGHIDTIICIRKMKDFRQYANDRRVTPVLDSDAAILIPHLRGEFSLPQDLASRATYVGPIVKPLPIDPVPVHIRFELVGKQVILISAGGGGHRDTTAFFNFCLAAFAEARIDNENLAAILVTGPLFHDWHKLMLTSNVRICPFDPDFTSNCATADLILSQAGYNSVNELATLAAPTILIPATRGFDNQFERAVDAGNRYPNIDCFSGSSIHELAKLIKYRLEKMSDRVRLEAPDGAYLAALEILKTVSRV